jgi:hypothetical protein
MGYTGYYGFSDKANLKIDIHTSNFNLSTVKFNNIGIGI